MDDRFLMTTAVMTSSFCARCSAGAIETSRVGEAQDLVQ